MSSELPESIWQQELESIGSRRRGVLRELRLQTPVDIGNSTELRRRQEEWEHGDQRGGSARQKAHRMRAFGLAFSGGGIRSATFNLGVLQGLAEQGLLKHVDYLSTVSGGGYIGAWLQGLISNRFKGRVTDAERFLTDTHGTGSRVSNVPGVPETATPEHTEQDPIGFLRKYSNYLAPRAGLFGADVWVIGSIWVRNVFLNQIILGSLLASLIAAVLLVGLMQQQALGITVTWAIGSVAGWLARFVPESMARLVSNADAQATFDLLQAVTALALLGVATIIAARNLRDAKERTADATDMEDAHAAYPDWRLRSSGAVAPLLFAVCFLLIRSGVDRPLTGQAANWITGLTTWFPYFVAVIMIALYVELQVGGGFIGCFVDRRRHASGAAPEDAQLKAAGLVALIALICGVVTTLLMYGNWNALPMPHAAGDSLPAWVRITVGPPLMAISFMAGTSLMIGLMGVDYPDAAREWLARVGASLALVSAAWLALFGVAVFLPYLLAWLLDRQAWAGLSAIGAWLLATGSGVILGRRDDGAAATGRGAGVKSLVMSIAPAVFVAGYLVALACIVHVALGAVTGTQVSNKIWRASATPTVYTVRDASGASADSLANVSVEETAAPGWFTAVLTPVTRFEADYWNVLDLRTADAQVWRKETVWWLLGGTAGLFLIGIGASRRIDINEFSLHHFYKNRLVRCYLGASNARRRPNRMTGFDPTDDFPLASIAPGGPGPLTHTGPFAIINATLNLNTGSELARQERKGTSFTFTPLYSGFHPVISRRDREEERVLAAAAGTRTNDDETGFKASRGFLQTLGYTSAEGLHIGTTVAISGAAASPNAGSQTSGPLAFLLTVFDARLGWWLGNPRFGDSVKRFAGPKLAWKYLFGELFGLTTARTPFVNVSDGGHFENLGLYELVRRRCRYIIVSDAEQDGGLTFDGLGSAVRKCRTDFGVEITLNAEPLRLSGPFSTAHCIVGAIRYPEPDEFADSLTGAQEASPQDGECARGWLLYLKSTMTGDEPADVMQYRAAHGEFPHQTTADQFFSESQFESYRRLGLHVFRTAVNGCVPEDRPFTGHHVLQVFQTLAQRWSAPLRVSPESASRLADGYTALLRTLADRPELHDLAADLLPRLHASKRAMTTPVGTSDATTMVLWLEALQLMQNVFTEFHFEDQANTLSPRNAGWMEVFRGWAQSPVLKTSIWPAIRGDYNPAFRRFMDDLLAERPVSTWPASL
jgi:hypothetical protein